MDNKKQKKINPDILCAISFLAFLFIFMWFIPTPHIFKIILYIISLLIMIFVRINYPKNESGKALMILHVIIICILLHYFTFISSIKGFCEACENFPG